MQKVVIIGGGIFGVCTAYYLLEYAGDNLQVTLIENSDVACGASGKAGGFLALDWHGEATASLAALSYRLHLELAEHFDGENTYGFRHVNSFSATAHESDSKEDISLPDENIALSGSAMRPLPKSTAAESQDWLDKVSQQHVLGTKATTSQVDPYLFTTALFRAARKAGLRYVRGSPTSLKRNVSGTSHSLNVQPVASSSAAFLSDLSSIDQITIDCDKIVIAAGPWSSSVMSTLGLQSKAKVGNLPGHSIVLKPAKPLPAAAVFSSIAGKGTSRLYTGSPEMFARPDGTIYIAGENGGVELPDRADLAPSKYRQASVDKLLKAAAMISSDLDVSKGATIVKQSLCYRPITPDGMPIVDFWDTDKSIVLATAAGPWGITLGPGAGKIVSEMLLSGQAKSAKISRLGATRF